MYTMDEPSRGRTSDSSRDQMDDEQYHNSLSPRRRARDSPLQSTNGAGRRSASLDRNVVGPDVAELSEKTKGNLALVPCKFFRNGSCASGDACPFSHIVQDQVSPRAVCQWFLKGNCKFGHKCALAHVHPGQPTSMDRKNKRTAQLASRDSNRNISNPEEFEKSTDAVTRSPPFGFPSKSVPSFATVASGLTDNASLSGVGQTIGNGRHPWPSALAGALLAATSSNPLESQPKLSSPVPLDSTSTVDSFHRRKDSNTDLGLRSSSLQRRDSGSLFGTSPFQAPGEEAIFLSASLGSEDGTVPFRGTITNGERRSKPLQVNGWAIEDENRHEEDCLPSSLSELLTPEEMHRQRERKAQAYLTEFSFSRSLPLQSAFNLPERSPNASSSGTNLAEIQTSSGARNNLISRNGNTSIHPSENLPDTLISPLSANLNVYRAHPPGSSLPPGLAAGLSRLHFVPALHTGNTPGNTPPSNASSPPSTSPGGRLGASLQMPAGSNLGRNALSRPAHLPHTHSVGSPLARTVSWQAEMMDSKPSRSTATNHLSFDDEEDSIPFAMDEA